MNTKTVFNGFTPDVFQFFADISENNCKAWFDKHKDVYTGTVVPQMKAFFNALSPAVYSIDSRMNLNPVKAISRIYRDIRFSKDKSPYKTCMWIGFQRMMPDWKTFPGYFIEVRETGYNYGMGIFTAQRKDMDTFRSLVGYDTDGFIKISNDIINKHHFMIEGEIYKRKIANDLPECLQQWIQRKGIYVHKDLPRDHLLGNPAIADYIAGEFIALKPLYDFFVEVCEP
ncbi:MAG: DUF2461 domain-containing protein [Dysgonamonadaceae bacterium]|jgi:uncharacterized protein (TIGR02453 family)|nr:DUF2461 domain-containing protein [Dysgonamonadaceae bacterium]